jgi:ATP-binding cassette subfamily B protein
MMVALIAIGTGLDTLQSFTLGQLVAAIANKTDPIDWFWVLLGTWMFGYLFARGYGIFSSYTIMQMRVRIHDDLFAHILKHAPRYFLDQASGAIAHKIRVAAGSCTNMIDYAVANIPRLVILLGSTVYLMARNVPDVLPWFGLFLAVFTAISGWMAQKLRHYAKVSSEAATAQSARLVDTVANWDQVLSFARAFFERGALAPFSEKEASTHVKLRLTATLMRVLLHVMGVSFLAWFLWIALQKTTTGKVDLATFTMLVSLCIMVAGYINAMGDNLFAYFETYGNLANALDTILAPHEIIDAPEAQPLKVAGGKIEIKDVS